MNRIILSLGLLLTMVSVVKAQPQSDYYKSINGKKKVDLKLAVKAVIADHRRLTYGSTLPQAYQSVYTVESSDGSGKTYVYDMFSNDKYTFADGGWNKEHVVPKSWWGGETNNAYADLLSVIPSESAANNKKSNYPVGEVNRSTSPWTNGCTMVGKPVAGQGGSYSMVFEPADEYKGDFARIYFYVATCYSDINWGSSATVKSEIKKEDWPTLNPWLYQLLLKWHNQDPVSAKEAAINDSVEAIQHNRNPFIDYPVLADYIWGDSTVRAFNLETAVLYKHISVLTDSITPDPIDPDTIVSDTTEVDTIIGGDVMAETGIATFDFNKDCATLFPTLGTSMNGSTAGDITEAVTATVGKVGMTISPKVGSSSTPNRIWQATDVTLRVYSGTISFVVPEGSKITKIEFDAKKWDSKNSADSGSITCGVWTGSAQSVAVTIAGNTQVNSVTVTVETLVEVDGGGTVGTDGDVNGDGTVDTQDVLSVYDYMMKSGAEKAPKEDVNGDGAVDTQDVLAVYGKMMGN